MQSVGICGSDVHFFVDGRIGDFVVESPMVMGHEGSAVVVAIGEGVTNLKAGKGSTQSHAMLYMLGFSIVNPLPTIWVLFFKHPLPTNLGDRVAIEPGIPCRICSFCKVGRYNLCPDVKLGSCPPEDGFLTRFKSHPADFCYK